MDSYNLILVIMLILCVITIGILLLLLLRQKNITKTYQTELQRLCDKIFLESDLIEQSFQTISEAYKVGIADIKDYISEYQKTHDKKRK